MQAIGLTRPGLSRIGAPAGLSLVPGAVAYWDCTQVVGQVLPDLSGNGNHGQLGSTPGADTNDPNGMTLSGDDYFIHPSLTFTNGEAHTYSAVIRYSATPPEAVIPFGDTTSVASSIYLMSTFGQWIFRSATDVHTGSRHGISSLIFDNRWHSVTWSVAASRTILLFVDGVLVDSMYASDTGIEYAGVGRGYSSNTYNWIGDIAGVIAYPYALSPGEAARIHSNFRTIYAPIGVDLP
jgi:hypothetical protein